MTCEILPVKTTNVRGRYRGLLFSSPKYDHPANRTRGDEQKLCSSSMCYRGQGGGEKNTPWQRKYRFGSICITLTVCFFKLLRASGMAKYTSEYTGQQTSRGGQGKTHRGKRWRFSVNKNWLCNESCWTWWKLRKALMSNNINYSMLTVDFRNIDVLL